MQNQEKIRKNKVKGLRQKGFIPAVVYAEGKDSQAIKVSHRRINPA